MARESLVVIGTQVVDSIVINVCYEAWGVIELLVLWGLSSVVEEGMQGIMWMSRRDE